MPRKVSLNKSRLSLRNGPTPPAVGITNSTHLLFLGNGFVLQNTIESCSCSRFLRCHVPARVMRETKDKSDTIHRDTVRRCEKQMSQMRHLACNLLSFTRMQCLQLLFLARLEKPEVKAWLSLQVLRGMSGFLHKRKSKKHRTSFADEGLPEAVRAY